MINQDIELTQERLKEVLDYNPETGIFIWKLPRQKISIGNIAGNKINNGYIRITIDYKSYLAHRLAWLFVYGYFPKCGIDHRDRIKDNNRIRNLREITQSHNSINSKARTNNTSGVKGVHYHKSAQKWCTQISILGKQIYLGLHENKLGAVKDRYKAEIKYGYTDISSMMSDAQLYVLKYESEKADKALIESYQNVINDETYTS